MSASMKTIRKAYLTLSLTMHPDRVAESERVQSTAKFQILNAIHSILTDSKKKEEYDTTGTLGEYFVDSDKLDFWKTHWREMYDIVTGSKIEDYLDQYKDSQDELADIKRSYMCSNGSMDYIMQCVPGCAIDDEPRVVKIIDDLIKEGHVPAFKKFTDESEESKEKRRKKMEAETRRFEKTKKAEAEKHKKTLVKRPGRKKSGALRDETTTMELTDSEKEEDSSVIPLELVNKIRGARTPGMSSFQSMISDLEKKYGGAGATSSSNGSQSQAKKRRKGAK